MKKILIVDDQQQVRELVEVTLRDENYLVLQAGSGEEAVKTAKKEKPELIIKKGSATRDCKVIMLTAKGQDTDIEKGYKAGAEGYFVKPFSPLDLIRKVEESLG